MFLKEVQDLIGKLRASKNDAQTKQRELRQTLEGLQKEIGELGAIPVNLGDITDGWNEEIKTCKDALRKNIRAYLTEDSQAYNTTPIWRDHKSLRQFLSPFGARYQGGKDIDLMLLLGCECSMKKLKEMAEVELAKLDAENFGQIPMSEKQRAMEKIRRQIEEIKICLKELSQQ